MKKYEIDMMNGKVYIDPAFATKAGQLGSPEFAKFMELKTSLPGFTFEEKKLNADKNTYKGLKIEVMEAFIMFYEKGEQKEAALREFYSVVAEGDLKGRKSPFVKSWFISKYKEPYNKSSFAQKKESKQEEVIKSIRTAAAAQTEGGIHHG